MDIASILKKLRELDSEVSNIRKSVCGFGGFQSKLKEIIFNLEVVNSEQDAAIEFAEWIRYGGVYNKRKYETDKTKSMG